MCDNNCTNYLAYKSVGYVIGTLTEVLLATQGKIAKRVLNWLLSVSAVSVRSIQPIVLGRTKPTGGTLKSRSLCLCIDRFHMTSRRPCLCTKKSCGNWTILTFFYSKQFAKLLTTRLKTNGLVFAFKLVHVPLYYW